LGDEGALSLSKALQINSSLVKLRWDENDTTVIGYSQFLNGMKRNIKLKDMDVPLIDISNCLKSYQHDEQRQKLNRVIKEIEQIIQANHSPKSRFKDQENNSDISQQLMTSFQREEIEKVSVKIKSTGFLKDDKSSKSIVLEAQTFDEVVDELRATKRDIYKFF